PVSVTPTSAVAGDETVALRAVDDLRHRPEYKNGWTAGLSRCGQFSTDRRCELAKQLQLLLDPMRGTTALGDRQQRFAAGARATGIRQQNPLDPATAPFAPEQAAQKPPGHESSGDDGDPSPDCQVTAEHEEAP